MTAEDRLFTVQDRLAQCTLPHWQTQQHTSTAEDRLFTVQDRLAQCTLPHWQTQQHTSTAEDRLCTVHLTTLADTAAHQHS